MSKLEWLRSLVEEVNQKHQKQKDTPTQQVSSSQSQRTTLEQNVLEQDALESVEDIFNKGLQGIIEPSNALRQIRIYEAKPYAFYETYPTFDRLNLNQLRWYLYWRQLVQNGIYTDTKEGYLFLYAFELLNLSFEADPMKAVAMLMELYEAYCERIPRIAAILPSWIGDMYTEFDKPESAAIWYEKTAPQQFDTAIFETYDLADTVPPYSVWKSLLHERTAFYRKHTEEMDICFTMLMKPLDQYFRKKRKKTLLEVLLPEKWMIEHARFYDWAVIERPVPTRRKISYSPRYRGRGSSLDLLIACLRYLENLFRDERKARLLKVKETLLAKPLKALLDQVFVEYRDLHPYQELAKPLRRKLVKSTNKEDKALTDSSADSNFVAIRIDPSVVETLHDESNWVRDAILSIEEPNLEEPNYSIDANRTIEPQDQEGVPRNEDVIQEKDYDPLQVEQLLTAASTLPEDLEALWGEFFQTLTEVEQGFIMWWLSHSTLYMDTQHLHAYIRKHGVMLYPVLDAMNEKALEVLGDILFEIDQEQVSWNEEFAAIVVEYNEIAHE